MVFPGGKSVGCDDEQTDPKGSTRAFGLGLSAKRAFDIVAATFGVALFAPILLITAIAIKLDSPGPILIRETLFGYGRRPVRLHKFRFATHTPETQLITAPLISDWSHDGSDWYWGTSSAFQRTLRRSVNRRAATVH